MTKYDETNRGALFKNDKKQHENQPDYNGRINVNGQDFWLSAWLKSAESGRKYMSLSVTAKEEQGRQQPQERTQTRREPPKTHGDRPGGPKNREYSGTGFDEMDSDVPF
jgi:hypothetical protein